MACHHGQRSTPATGMAYLVAGACWWDGLVSGRARDFRPAPVVTTGVRSRRVAVRPSRLWS